MRLTALLFHPSRHAPHPISRNSATLSNLATPSNPASFGDPLTFSDADDIMLMSPSKSEDIHVNHSIPTASNPSEGRTTAVIAVMRGNPKDGYTHQCSNKHCKQKIVLVLLDSGSDGDRNFVNKDKPMRCFPTQKG